MSKEPLADRLLRFDVTKVPEKIMLLDRPNYLQQIKDRLRGAHRMIFDESATAAVLDLIVNRPREIIANLDLVKAPFDPLWIEGPFRPDYWLDPENRKFEGELNGILIADDLVYPVSQLAWGKRGPTYCHSGWERHQIGADWSRDEQDALFTRYGVEADWRNWVFSRVTNCPAWVDLADEELRMILDHVRIDLPGVNPDLESEIIKNRSMINITLGGTIMLPLACLILLNTPRIIEEVHIPGFRRFFGGHMRPVRPHTVIKVTVGGDAVIRYIRQAHTQRNAEISQRRLHEVRGNWAHDRLARETACVHTWIIDDPKHSHCETCGGIRWWRIPHERGDPQIGRMPPRDYTVTGG